LVITVEWVSGWDVDGRGDDSWKEGLSSVSQEKPSTTVN
jgi:hypothetical protein